MSSEKLIADPAGRRAKEQQMKTILEGREVRETEKAICFRENHGFALWFPKSVTRVILEVSSLGGACRIEVPTAMYEAKVAECQAYREQQERQEDEAAEAKRQAFLTAQAEQQSRIAREVAESNAAAEAAAAERAAQDAQIAAGLTLSAEDRAAVLATEGMGGSARKAALYAMGVKYQVQRRHLLAAAKK